MHCIICIPSWYSWLRDVHQCHGRGETLRTTCSSTRAILSPASSILLLADEAVRTLIRLVQPQLQETVATTKLGEGLCLHGAFSHG